MSLSPPEAPEPLSNSAQLTLPLKSSDVGSVADSLRAAGIQPTVYEYTAPDGDATLVAQAECVFSRHVSNVPWQGFLRLYKTSPMSSRCGANVLEVALPRQVQGSDGKPVIVSGCITRCSACDRFKKQS